MRRKPWGVVPMAFASLSRHTKARWAGVWAGGRGGGGATGGAAAGSGAAGASSPSSVSSSAGLAGASSSSSDELKPAVGGAHFRRGAGTDIGGAIFHELERFRVRNERVGDAPFERAKLGQVVRRHDAGVVHAVFMGERPCRRKGHAYRTSENPGFPPFLDAIKAHLTA